MNSEGSMRFFQQIVSAPGLGLTEWVDAEQNNMVNGEPLEGGALRKACAQAH